MVPQRERNAPTRSLTEPEPRRAADLKLPPSLRPAMALSSPERMFGSDEKVTGSPRPAAAAKLESRPTQTLLAAGWEPPAAHAAEQKAARLPPAVEHLGAADAGSDHRRRRVGSGQTAGSDAAARGDGRAPRAAAASLLEGEKSRGPATQRSPKSRRIAASRPRAVSWRRCGLQQPIGSIDDRISLWDDAHRLAGNNKRKWPRRRHLPQRRSRARAKAWASRRIKLKRPGHHQQAAGLFVAKLVIEDLKQVKVGERKVWRSWLN